MERNKLRDLHNNLYLKYRDTISIEFSNKESDGFYSYIISKRVIIPSSVKTNQTEWSLFAFLHEIGHIITNTPAMKRCTQEYLATQWAINEAKGIGFKVPKSYIDTYQKYIWKWRETSIKHRGKNVPEKEELTLIA